MCVWVYSIECKYGIDRILTSSSVSQSDVTNVPLALPLNCSVECCATKFRHSNTGCWMVWRCVFDVTGTVKFKFVGFIEMCIICPKHEFRFAVLLSFFLSLALLTSITLFTWIHPKEKTLTPLQVHVPCFAIFYFTTLICSISIECSMEFKFILYHCFNLILNYNSMFKLTSFNWIHFDVYVCVYAVSIASRTGSLTWLLQVSNSLCT